MANEFKVRKALDVAGNSAVSGSSSVGGNQTVGGTLIVTGQTTLNGGVGGNPNFTGDVTIAQDLVVTGDLTVTGAFAFSGGSVFPDDTFQVRDEVDNTKAIALDVGSATTGTSTTIQCAQTVSRVVTLPDATTTLVGHDATQTISNKSLVDASTLIVDEADPTKRFYFDASAITTATDRALAVPDASGTVVLHDAAQTLINKTIDADQNTITNIENADIKAGAAIDRTKLASGTVDHVVINDAAGVISSEAQLAPVRGGIGIDLSAAAAGDIIYCSAPGVFAILPIGTPGQVLTVSAGGLPEWV
jgi:hypothetical protein